MPKKSNNHPPVRHDIECEVDGKVHRGTYYVEDGLVKVDGGNGSRSTWAGGRPESMAKRLLAEIVREGRWE